MKWPAASTPGIGHYLVAVEKKAGDGWETRSLKRVEADYIRPEAMKSLSEWRKNPEQWSKDHGE